MTENVRAPVTAPNTTAVRRHANRSAETFDNNDLVHREVGRRLLEHLAPVRIAPHRIIELGAATGRFTRELATHYPHASICCLDLAEKRLKRVNGYKRRWFRRHQLVAADAHQLPFSEHCADLVCANLLLHWLPHPQQMFTDCARVLRHGGLLMLSTFGPDTLQELAEFFAYSAQHHLHPLPDMHALGDAMVTAGFSDVVVDMEVLRAPYRGLSELAKELRLTGSTFAGSGRGLVSSRALRALASSFDADQECEVSFEVIYLHGWYLDKRSVEVTLPGA